MKRPTLLPVMVLLIMLATSCSSESLDEKASNANTELIVPETKTIEVEIMELINDHRLNMGLNPLTNIGTIKAHAFNHTDYMIEQNNVSHDYFYQRKNSLVNSVGANKVSENVAYGFTSAESVVNAWLNSEGHRGNIEGDYTDFEISAEQNAEGRWYYTNIFVKK